MRRSRGGSGGGGKPSAWYVGVTDDPQHVPKGAPLAGEQDPLLMYRQACTSQAAYAVRDYFVTQYGTDGDAGVEDQGGRFVYLRKKACQVAPTTHLVLDPALTADI